MRATNQFNSPTATECREFPRGKPRDAHCIKLGRDRSGYRSAIEDDRDRRRSQSTLWAKILA
ncbi:MAG: hypothetical protein ICV52_02780, partial [Microcoleus sp. C1-bin4]|nr:hypothetical protein [Microcoleus sp. C1-bin4]